MSGRADPLVSVVVSVYKSVGEFRETLNTILSQSLASIEILVVNDGNSLEDTESLREICSADARVRLIENSRNRGLTQCLIQGVSEARGRYIARIDNGDLMVPRHRLEWQYGELEADNNLVIIGGDIEIVDALNGFRFRSNVGGSVQSPVNEAPMSNIFFHMAVMFRKDTYFLTGGYNSQFRVGQDSDLWPRMLAYGYGKNLADVVAIAPMAPNSISVKKNRDQILQKLRRIDAARTQFGVFRYMLIVSLERLKLVTPIRIRVFLRYMKNMKMVGIISKRDSKDLSCIKEFYCRKGFFD